jgi:hypothetical protein
LPCLSNPFTIFPRRVVGIRHKIEVIRNRQDLEQARHFIEQSALVAIGPYQPLMNTHGQRHSKAGLRCVHQQSDGLQAVAHDVLGLRTAIRLLVQELHAWHLLAAF